MKSLVPRALCAALLVAGLAGGPVAADAHVSTVSGSKLVGAHIDKKKQIIMKNFFFIVPPKVRAGSIIRVVNDSTKNHTVTSVDGSFRIYVRSHESHVMTVPETKGDYGFFCEIHTAMKAVLVVK